MKVRGITTKHLPPSTKQLTDEIKPLRNELNGNVPTKQQ